MLTGSDTADTIRGYAGADTIFGRAGSDALYGGRGADRMFPGDDTVKDVLQGGPGNDRIFVRYNGDTAYAGDGNDTLVVARRPTSWTHFNVHCGAGYDTVYAPSGWLTGNTSGCEKWIWTAK